MYLTAETKKNLENFIGKSLADISKMSADEEKKFIKEKTGLSPHFSKVVDYRMLGRGNPLLSRKRIYTAEDVDKWIGELR